MAIDLLNFCRVSKIKIQTTVSLRFIKKSTNKLKLALNVLSTLSNRKFREILSNPYYGGHDVVAIGPEGTGKSTRWSMGV